MKIILKLLIIGLIISSCASKLHKIEGVFVNEDASDNNRVLFFLFQDDSLSMRSHIKFSKKFVLKYNSKSIIATGYNDSISFKIIPKGHNYEITYPGKYFLSIIPSSNNEIGKAKISPLTTKYDNSKPIFGYWKSTDTGDVDESWIYINENNELIEVSYVDGELIEYITNRGSTPLPKGKILNLKGYYFIEFLSGNYSQGTALIDFLEDDMFQIFTLEFNTNLKIYSHFKRVNFEYLPKELKKQITENEVNPTRYDYEGGIIHELKFVPTIDEEIEIPIIDD